MREAIVVLLIVLPMLIIAFIVADLLSPDEPGSNNSSSALECLTGEAAQNPTRLSPFGRELALPANEQFDTVEAGEAFICLDVAQLHHAGERHVNRMTAQRWAAQGVARIVGAHYSNGSDPQRDILLRLATVE